MKKIINLFLITLLFSGCQKHKNYTEKSIPYNDALLHCEKIKEKNPDNYFKLHQDCMCGSQVPNFTASSIEGELIKSSDFHGKLTVINFWATWCAPCIAEVPGLNALVDRYKESVNFISIASNSKSEVEKFLVDNPWKFKHISNEENLMDSVFRHKFSYPTTYLLNKEGIIIRSFSGGTIGEYAPYHIQKKLIPAIQLELSSLPKEYFTKYPNKVGDIKYNTELDDQTFSICNSENILQYFNNLSGLEYKGEKAEIIQIFKDNFEPTNLNTDNGLITVRFIVNCKGEIGRFRLSQMDIDYNEKQFSESISDQILSITKSLKGWQPKELNENPIDYYQILSFKLEKGHIIDILP